MTRIGDPNADRSPTVIPMQRLATVKSMDDASSRGAVVIRLAFPLYATQRYRLNPSDYPKSVRLGRIAPCLIMCCLITVTFETPRGSPRA